MVYDVSQILMIHKYKAPPILCEIYEKLFVHKIDPLLDSNNNNNTSHIINLVTENSNLLLNKYIE